MAKLAVVADVHVHNHGAAVDPPGVDGLNLRATQTLRVMERAVEKAAGEECTHLVVAGDLLHVPRPEPAIVHAIGRVFQQATDAGMDVVLLRGNHEESGARIGGARVAWSALDVFAYQPRVFIIDSFQEQHFSIGSERQTSVAFVPAGQEWQMEDAPPARIIIAHVGLSDESMPNYLRGGLDVAKLYKLLSVGRSGPLLFLAGDFHSHKRWVFGEHDYVQIGALVPTGWNNPGIASYGSVIIVDTSNPKAWYRHVLEGPRFVEEFNDSVVHELQTVWPKTWQAILDRKLGAAIWAANRAPTAEPAQPVLTGGGAQRAGERRQAVAAARAAAASAQAASSLQGAAAAFVGSMKLDEGVDREVVTNRVLEVLRANS